MECAPLMKAHSLVIFRDTRVAVSPCARDSFSCLLLQENCNSALGAEVFFGVLFAGLFRHQHACHLCESKDEYTFAGFPTFWPMTFHLLCSYSLMAANNAALCT